MCRMLTRACRRVVEDVQRFAQRYQRSLRKYIDQPKVAPRDRAYLLGLWARADGLGVTDVAIAHTAALRALLGNRQRNANADALIRLTGGFLAECLLPFDESSRAWPRLNQALENETKRIARALHDEAGQLLASVHLAIADLAQDLPQHRRARVDEVKWLLRRIENELRSLSHELRPVLLDHLGLRAALQSLADNVARRTRMMIAVDGDDPGRLPPELEITLYRIAQEALNNVVRHAQASSASIELYAAVDRVSCTVRDNGVGFAAHRARGSQGLGLLMIRERLSALDGTLKLSSTPRRGTTLCAEIPRGAA